MNAIEQRTHKRAVDQVRSDVEAVISAFVEDQAKDFKALRGYVDAQDQRLFGLVDAEIHERQAFVRRSFRERCRWLFFGR